MVETTAMMSVIRSYQLSLFSTLACAPPDFPSLEWAYAAPPVVAAGWSYGGDVLSDLADTVPVDCLVYVASYPEPVGAGSEAEPVDLASLPHLLFPDEATLVLNNDWWLSTPEVRAFPPEVISHLQEHKRRPITRSAFLAHSMREAWRAIPMTILLGRSDSLMSAVDREWVRTHFDDVRIVDGDHFLPLLRPDLVAGVLAETFAASS